MIRWLAVALGVAALLAGGWFGWRALDRPAATGPVRTAQVVPEGVPDDIETVATGGPATVPGTTPMAQRVAVLGFLNKRNGEARELTLKPGGAVRIGDVVVRLSACDRTAPWEADPLTGAFVQMDVRGADRQWRRVFSGWLFKERPSLNVVQHPVYDVWAKSCTMSFPTTGEETESVAPKRSSARKSPTPAPSSAAKAVDTPSPDSASPSNAT
ncbi:hypothetical protein GCM10011380_04860 [Sphingomonas metalli]|uniref:DUF2155 domain-containing protein n=1 Tax=Sphingomonas metalli TaxID=1779358 RepID=A0A916SX93_9SPHN|nr:hypothetical protein GCM10011380_04860 [Sphingomonas metalli]